MHWGAAPAEDIWLTALHTTLQRPGVSVALYIHIPFCQSLCTFCGCNMRLARNHAMAAPYVETLLQEFAHYRQRFGATPLPIGELHLGGGTPTWLPPGALDRLLDGILQHCTLAATADLAIEADPRNTTREHLQVLRRHGFRRLSIGVQDFDARVLDIVNRVQSETDVRALVEMARELDFDSLSFDLIYGLPLQTTDSLRDTFDCIDRLAPDRVSYLPYAHVPWIKPSQRRYTEADLPEPAARLQLFVQGRERLGAAGFVEIGMDQYARSHDALARALAQGTLHRNFMGFTASATQALIGLGVSAIGDTSTMYAQNEKNLQQYEARVQAGALPLQRGCVLTAADQRIRALLWKLFTRSQADLEDQDLQADSWPGAASGLQSMADDGLLQLNNRSIVVTATGRAFLCSIGMAFDTSLREVAAA
jgi:oxygen-independent coproporphyrinogen-3 oxidase